MLLFFILHGWTALVYSITHSYSLSFNNLLLSTYYVPSMLLGAEATGLNKTDKNLYSFGTSNRRGKAINKYTSIIWRKIKMSKGDWVIGSEWGWGLHEDSKMNWMKWGCDSRKYLQQIKEAQRPKERRCLWCLKNRKKISDWSCTEAGRLAEDEFREERHNWDKSHDNPQ